MGGRLKALKALLTGSSRGSSMAWAAMLLAVVMTPLMILIGDGARLLYVHGRLITAAEAACEDASWTAADRYAWQVDNLEQYDINDRLPIYQARTTFNQILAPQSSSVSYVPSLSIQIDSANRRVLCSATAVVYMTFQYQPVTLHAQATSRLRFATAP